MVGGSVGSRVNQGWVNWSQGSRNWSAVKVSFGPSVSAETADCEIVSPSPGPRSKSSKQSYPSCLVSYDVSLGPSLSAESAECGIVSPSLGPKSKASKQSYSSCLVS